MAQQINSEGFMLQIILIRLNWSTWKVTYYNTPYNNKILEGNPKYGMVKYIKNHILQKYSGKRIGTSLCTKMGMIYNSDFQGFSSHGIHKLITKILWFLCWFDRKNRYNFDSFTLDSYWCVGCCQFFIWLSKGKEVSAPD